MCSSRRSRGRSDENIDVALEEYEWILYDVDTLHAQGDRRDTEGGSANIHGTQRRASRVSGTRDQEARRWRRAGDIFRVFSVSLSLFSLFPCTSSSAGPELFEEIWCKKKVEHGTEVVERVPGKLKGTLDSPLPTMRPPTRSQHTNFRGVRRIDFNVVVFTETATRATVTSTTSRVLVEHRAMPWRTCSAAKQNRQFGTRIF